MALKWTAASAGKVTWVEWSEWLDSDRRIDPYLVWADVTDFVGVGRVPGAQDKLPLMIEFSSDDLLLRAAGPESSECGAAHPLTACIDVLSAYLRTAGGQTRTTARFVTARAAPMAIEMLLKSTEIVTRFQLGLPRITSANEPSPPPPDLILDERRAPRTVVGIIDDGCAFAHPRFANRERGRLDESRVVCVWDQDPAREGAKDWEASEYGARLNTRSSQRSSVGSSDEYGPYEKVDYVPIDAGPEMHGTSRQVVSPGSPGSAPGDQSRQRAPRHDQASGMYADRLPLQAMQIATHGTGVMDLAFGDTPPATPDRSSNEGGTLPPPDFASNWDVVFVQLPTRTVLDTSGGSLGVHVLDAVHFIVREAEKLPYKKSSGVPMSLGGGGSPPSAASARAQAVQPERIARFKTLFDASDSERSTRWKNGGGGAFRQNSVVINISYGTTAGPHDGTSMLECALQELLEKRPFTSMVVAAGNAHRSKTHARLNLLRGESKSFSWQLAPDNPLESYLEVWIPALDIDGKALAAEVQREFVLRIRPPGFEAFQQVFLGGLSVLQDDVCGQPVAGAIFCRKVAQGLNGTMFLLAAAPTRSAHHPMGTGRAAAPHGEWIVEVGFDMPGSVPGGAAVQVHAWAERNDLLFGSRRRQQSTVVGDDRVPEATEFMPDSVRLLRGRGTLSSVAQRDLVGPEFALGSLANGSSVDLQGDSVRQLWVVGGHRLSDGEMAGYSSGGPSLGRGAGAQGTAAGAASAKSAASAGQVQRAHQAGAPVSDWRMCPDIDAPSDVSNAARGLPVAGFRPGLNARLSGTSAAAPIVTRWLANMWYACNPQNNVSEDDIRHLVEKNLVLDELQERRPGDGAQASDAARPTFTPTLDDLYRRGRLRLRWWPR